MQANGGVAATLIALIKHLVAYNNKSVKTRITMLVEKFIFNRAADRLQNVRVLRHHLLQAFTPEKSFRNIACGTQIAVGLIRAGNSAW
jgi:hypothetical protein